MSADKMNSRLSSGGSGQDVRLYQPASLGLGNGMRSVIYAHHVEDVSQLSFYRGWTEEKIFCDSFCRLALGHHLQDLGLTFGQVLTV